MFIEPKDDQYDSNITQEYIDEQQRRYEYFDKYNENIIKAAKERQKHEIQTTSTNEIIPVSNIHYYIPSSLLELFKLLLGGFETTNEQNKHERTSAWSPATPNYADTNVNIFVNIYKPNQLYTRIYPVSIQGCVQETLNMLFDKLKQEITNVVQTHTKYKISNDPLYESIYILSTLQTQSIVERLLPKPGTTKMKPDNPSTGSFEWTINMNPKIHSQNYINVALSKYSKDGIVYELASGARIVNGQQKDFGILVNKHIPTHLIEQECTHHHRETLLRTNYITKITKMNSKKETEIFYTNGSNTMIKQYYNYIYPLYLTCFLARRNEETDSKFGVGKLDPSECNI
jgi:hypothetical protein